MLSMTAVSVCMVTSVCTATKTNVKDLGPACGLRRVRLGRE